MASVFDAAKYLLRICGRENQLPVTTWKLHALIYFAQGWSLVRDGAPLFRQDIQAWPGGPVCPALHKEHRSVSRLRSLSKGNVRHLSPAQKDTVDAVVRHYGVRSAERLSVSLRQEGPWRDARRGLGTNVRGDRTITLDAMADYFRRL
jgi:uncharacterized phage-associated protein